MLLLVIITVATFVGVILLIMGAVRANDKPVRVILVVLMVLCLVLHLVMGTLLKAAFWKTILR